MATALFGIVAKSCCNDTFGNVAKANKIMNVMKIFKGDAACFILQFYIS